MFFVCLFCFVFTSSLKSKTHDVFDDTTFCGMFSDCSRADRKHVAVESTWQNVTTCSIFGEGIARGKHVAQTAD